MIAIDIKSKQIKTELKLLALVQAVHLIKLQCLSVNTILHLLLLIPWSLQSYYTQYQL